jgi:hypothetical protein
MQLFFGKQLQENIETTDGIVQFSTSLQISPVGIRNPHSLKGISPSTERIPNVYSNKVLI